MNVFYHLSALATYVLTSHRNVNRDYEKGCRVSSFKNVLVFFLTLVRRVRERTFKKIPSVDYFLFADGSIPDMLRGPRSHVATLATPFECLTNESS